MTRSDLALLASGRALFTGDLPLPVGCLHAQPAPAPHAHATFTRVDADAARAVPGVVDVLVAADLPGNPGLLADGAVHGVGHPFALVVAESADAAWRAARVVDADWTPLPPALDPAAGRAAGDLIQPPRVLACGDVDAAWASCATVVTGSIDLGSADHVYLETQCALAVPVEDGLVVHSSTQSPSAVQALVAEATGLPLHVVEVDVSRLGGGFGGKEEQAGPWAALAAVAARRTGRPVRLWLDRADDLRLTGKRHPYTATFRLGLDAEGRFVAYEVDLVQDAGSTTDLSPAILARSLFHATNAYAIPHVRVTGTCVRTDTASNTAFRGFGAPQGIFAIEAAIRVAARTLGVRPDELQERNLLAPGDRLPYGQVVSDAGPRPTWDALVARRDPAAVRAACDAWNAASPRVRRGMAVVPVCFGIAFTYTPLNQAEALVHVYADGTVGVTTGAIEMGQGVAGKIRAVVARTLGIGEEWVRVESTSTRRVANVSPTAASTGADLNGEAARQACLVVLGGLGSDAAGWQERVTAAYLARRPLSALAHVATPGLSVDAANHGTPFRYHVCGAALVEAEVDTLLGTGGVVRVTVVHDVGSSLDAATDLGQVEGAIAQGIGWVTCEEVVRDAAGRLLTDTLATYKVPDLPGAPTFDVVLHARPNPVGVLGSKAVGEPPLVYGLGAFFALQDAVASYAPGEAGEFRAPLTSERLFTLLHGEAGEGAVDAVGGDA